MNQYITGAVIRELRQQKNMTQLQLAQQLSVSDKTVSKWETGKATRISLCSNPSPKHSAFPLRN